MQRKMKVLQKQATGQTFSMASDLLLLKKTASFI
jgi:hypothetical protein